MDRIRKLVKNPRWIWSYLLTIVGVSGAVFAGRGFWWGWLISLAAQPLWIFYAVTTKQYGFIGAPLFFIPVYTMNMVSWFKS